MTGALLQLVALGDQDIYLTCNPQITFFKLLYKRHTNFSLEEITNNFNGFLDFGKKISFTIKKSGDLIYKMYLEITVLNNNYNNFIKRPAHNLIDYIEVEIGGKIIDKHYGEWLDLWTQLSHNNEKWIKYQRLVDGNLTSFKNPNLKTFLIPLQFWFNKNIGLSLPIISLQYHEVKINVKFKSIKSLFRNYSNEQVILNSAMLYTQYIFLDNDERKLFAQSNHKYLIEQIQFNGSDYYDSDDIIANIPLRFYHPIKEIIWIVQDNTYIPYNYPFTYVPFNNGKIINNDFVKSAYIEINGKQRIMKKSGSYYRMVQSWQHHTGNYKHFNKIVSNNLVSNKNIIEKGFIYLYSFALNPENYESSGTCNYSRISSSSLILELNKSNSINSSEFLNKNSKVVRIYAINYNILNITKGMAILEFS